MEEFVQGGETRQRSRQASPVFRYSGIGVAGSLRDRDLTDLEKIDWVT